jgi:hypothetical protein
VPAYQEGGGYPAAPPPARAASFLPGLVLGVIGGALMILGALLNWLKGGDSQGIDAPIKVFWSPNVGNPTDNFVTSAGFIVIILGLLVILGAALARGGLARVGAVLGIVAMALFTITLYRADGNIGDLGIGVWAILVGSIVALVGGFVARRPGVAPAV